MHPWIVSAAVSAMLLLGSESANGQESSKAAEKAKDTPAGSKDTPGPAKPERAPIPSLEEMLTKALKDNPDIRVAEAKLREAEAELNRTRLQVTQKVIAFQRSLDSQRALTELVEKDYKRISNMRKTGIADKTTETDIQQRLAQAKAKLAEVEAELPFLLGKQLQASAVADPRQYLNLVPNVNFERSRVLTNVDYSPLNIRWELQPHILHSPVTLSTAAPTGSTTDKLRKALDTQIQLQFDNTTVGEVLEFLESKAGVSFRASGSKEREIAGLNIRLRFKDPVALAAALQALEDSHPGLRFVVRDYGVLLTWSDKIPPGATMVDALWKAERQKPKAPDTTPAKSDAKK